MARALILLHDVPNIGRVWPHEKVLSECVTSCARVYGESVEEPLLHPGLVPEGAVVMDRGQGLLEKTVPGSRMGSQYSLWYGLSCHPQGDPPAAQNWSLGLQLCSLSFPESLLFIPTSLSLEVSENRRDCFPVTSIIPVPNNTILIQSTSG